MKNMRDYMKLVEDVFAEMGQDPDQLEESQQLDEIFGFSQAEKGQKALDAIAAEVKAAKEIRDTWQQVKAVDVAAMKAISQGADFNFFAKLGFQSSPPQGKMNGTFYVPDVWQDRTGAHEFQTIYAVECLVGPLTDREQIDVYSYKKYLEQMVNKWMPTNLAKTIWIVKPSSGSYKSVFFMG